MRGTVRPSSVLRLVVLGMSLLAAAVAVAACGSDDKSSTSGGGGSTSSSGTAKAKAKCPVRVLYVGNLTGAGSQNGASNSAGIAVALDEINGAGGVLGCKVVVDKKDDGSDYSKTLPVLQKATSQTKYAMVGAGDFGCVTTAPYVTRQNLLQITGCAQTKFATKNNPTIFDVTYIAARAALVAAQAALDDGHKKIALMVDNTELGRGDVVAIQDLVKKAGGTVTDVEKLDLAGVNFSSAVQRAKASNPDAVFTDMFGAAAGHLHNDIKTAGWTVPVYNGSDDAATSFKGLAPLNALEGGITVGPATMSKPSNPTRQKFLDALKAKGTKIDTFLFGYANGHDPLTLFAWAANATGSLDAKTLADKLHNSGDVKIPNLLQGETTGYTPTCGEWNAKDGLALMKAGYYDQGRLELIKTATAPPLPAELNEC